MIHAVRLPISLCSLALLALLSLPADAADYTTNIPPGDSGIVSNAKVTVVKTPDKTHPNQFQYAKAGQDVTFTRSIPLVSEIAGCSSNSGNDGKPTCTGFQAIDAQTQAPAQAIFHCNEAAWDHDLIGDGGWTQTGSTTGMCWKKLTVTYPDHYVQTYTDTNATSVTPTASTLCTAPDQTKHFCSVTYHGNNKIIGATQDDMFRINSDTNAFMEYLPISPGNIKGAYRLSWIKRDPAANAPGIVLPSGPVPSYSDYKRFLKTPPGAAGVQTKSACYPFIISDPCGVPSEPNVAATCGAAATIATAVAPTSNLCAPYPSAPVATPTLSAGNLWTWTCKGINGGANSPSCTAPLQGLCNPLSNGQTLAAMPVNPNLCTTGTATVPVVTSTGWTWSCSGANAATTAACSATLSVPPEIACSINPDATGNIVYLLDDSDSMGPVGNDRVGSPPIGDDSVTPTRYVGQTDAEYYHNPPLMPYRIEVADRALRSVVPIQSMFYSVFNSKYAVGVQGTNMNQTTTDAYGQKSYVHFPQYKSKIYDDGTTTKYDMFPGITYKDSDNSVSSVNYANMIGNNFLNINTITAGTNSGTPIAQALMLTADALGRLGEDKPATIVVMTDGGDSKGIPNTFFDDSSHTYSGAAAATYLQQHPAKKLYSSFGADFSDYVPVTAGPNNNATANSEVAMQSAALYIAKHHKKIKVYALDLANSHGTNTSLISLMQNTNYKQLIQKASTDIAYDSDGNALTNNTTSYGLGATGSKYLSSNIDQLICELLSLAGSCDCH